MTTAGSVEETQKLFLEYMTKILEDRVFSNTVDNVGTKDSF